MGATDEKHEKPASRDFSLLATAVRGVSCVAAGGLVAINRINSYARTTFSKLGMFQELESRLAAKLKSHSDPAIALALRESRFDVDLGWVSGGVFEELSQEYRNGVKAIFREQGAETLAGKWRTILTSEQKVKTLLWATGAAVMVGAFVFRGSKPEQLHPHAEQVQKERMIVAASGADPARN